MRVCVRRGLEIVPIDLNLSNFLLADDGRLVALDLEACWSGDPLLAYGEWRGVAQPHLRDPVVERIRPRLGPAGGR
jgi:hypothetical protein